MSKKCCESKVQKEKTPEHTFIYIEELMEEKKSDRRKKR